MLTKQLRYVLLLIIALAFVSQARAAVSPLSVSILPPVQFPSEDFSITGARVSALWGKHRDLYGVDIGGIGNITEQDFVGIGASGLFNMTKGTTTILGLQAAGGANINKNKTKVYGLQAAIGANYNTAASSIIGLQVAAANLSAHTTIYGLQVGVYNRALEVYGFQIGLINFASSLHGIQIGLLNFHEKGVFSVSPIINVGF